LFGEVLRAKRYRRKERRRKNNNKMEQFRIGSIICWEERNLTGIITNIDDGANDNNGVRYKDQITIVWFDLFNRPCNYSAVFFFNSQLKVVSF
jgi:hypothetical protein